jgi:spore germination protein YaaH
MNAPAILERAVYQYYFYTVVGGDNLEIIARRFGTNVARIKSDNNLPSHIIHPGQVLMLYRELPLLTIRTFDDHISDTTAPMETETVENENLNLAVANITTPGSPALVRATLRIVRVNGVEVDRYYLAPQIIEPGVTEIIEIGTGDAEVDIRN